MFQTQPCPDMEYAEYSVVKEIDINRYDKTTGEEIAKWMTAMMSTSGGLVVLYCNRAESDKKRDLWLMNLKDHVTTKWIPNSAYRSLIRYKYLKIMDQLRIYLFVCKSSHMITFKYNAYGRHATGIEPVTDRDEVQKILTVGHGTAHIACTSQLQRVLGKRNSFDFNEKIPTEHCESQSIEFKHFYGDDIETKEMVFAASNLKSRLDRDKELLNNVSAFANTDGGSLILGVKESGKHPVVRGFETTDNQRQEEKELTRYLERSLNECIWSGNSHNQPVRKIDWDVFYHSVIHPGGKLNKIVEIRVAKHRGGMFLKPPTCYTLNDSGDLVTLPTFGEWLGHFCPRPASGRKEEKRNQLEAHMKGPAEFPSKGKGDSSHIPKSVQSNRANNNNLPESQDAQSMKSGDFKLQKTFEGDEIQIKVHELNLLDCCTEKMASYLKTSRGQKVWYPSVKATHTKNSDSFQYESLVEYINKKDWHGIAAAIHTESESGFSGPYTNTGLVSCVLILSTNSHPKLIYCLDAEPQDQTMQEPHHDHQHIVRYALHHARKLKKKFFALAVNRPHQSDPFHFEVEVLNVAGPITQLWDSEREHSQPVSYPHVEHHSEFAIACNGLSDLLLKTRCTVKDRHGDVLIDHLTEEQARILLDRKERVLVVTGRSGTGKTVIALHMVHDATIARGYTANEVLYICSNEGLRAFVNFQAECHVMVLKATGCLSSQQRDLLIKNARVIVVDDIHTISLSEDWKTNPDDLYHLLFTHAAKRKAEVAIFFDHEQDYQSSLPENFHTELRDLAERIATGSDGRMTTQDIKLYTLNENIRNSRKINRFMQANQTQAKVEGSRVCLNEREGDGVIYDFIGSNLEENVFYLDAKFRELVQQYKAQSIVVLCDHKQQMESVKTIMKEKFHWQLQSEKTFPAQGIVISMLDDFSGLEGEVVLFLMPSTFGAENRGKWKYINCVSSRAKQKLEFLLPWNEERDPVRLQKTKMFLELFQTVSVF